MSETYFRKGFGLKKDIEGSLTADYASGVVDAFLKGGHTITAGPLTFRLAKEFGFCYGVDRAVEYAYETRAKFPDRPIALVGEIIHNPHVNSRLQQMGVRFLAHGADGEFDFSALTTDDVVIMPAFGSYTGGLAVSSPAFDGLLSDYHVWMLGGRAVHRFPASRVR